MIPEGTSFHLLLQIGPPGALEIAPLRVAPSPALRPLTVSCSACVCLAIVGGAVVETWGEVSYRYVVIKSYEPHVIAQNQIDIPMVSVHSGSHDLAISAVMVSLGKKKYQCKFRWQR